MNNELTLIKVVLFNAQTIDEALCRFDELGISYRESDTVDMFFIDAHNIQFWTSRSNKCPITVLIDNHLACYDDRVTFLAQQQEPGFTPEVPANVSPATVAEHPTLKVRIYARFYPKLPVVRHIIREERRLKRSQAEGFQL